MEDKVYIENILKDIPILYDKKENCCGCSACFAICSKHAITMETDEEGFAYPVVNKEKCVRCYQCLKVCAFKAGQRQRGYMGA